MSNNSINVSLPKWLRARVPHVVPRGFLSTLLQEALIELFPKPSLVKHWDEATEKAEAALILAKAKAMREQVKEAR